MDFIDSIKKTKEDSFILASLPAETRNDALERITKALETNKEAIFEANAKDLERAKEAGLPAPIVNRLVFDQHKMKSCIDGIYDLIDLEDPLFQDLLKRELDTDLILTKTTCPIGVIGVIFESRPDALVQIASLCIKSGNCSILKGGSEARNTNRILFDTIYQAAVEAGLPESFSVLIENRASIDELLKCHEYVDLLIPRGSNEFVQYIMNNLPGSLSWGTPTASVTSTWTGPLPSKKPCRSSSIPRPSTWPPAIRWKPCWSTKISPMC